MEAKIFKPFLTVVCLMVLTSLALAFTVDVSMNNRPGVVMKLPDTMRRALTLEIGMQNAGLGAVLARQLFESREAIAIAPAMYTFGCMLTGTLLAGIWARRSGNA